MVHAALRSGVVVALVMLCTGCGSSGPTSPSVLNSPPQLSPSPVEAPRTDLPPLSGPSRTFVFDRALSYSVQENTTKSGFVLYDNGAFVLQFNGISRYRGKYVQKNGDITFEWEGWSTAGPWGATGSLSEDFLSVQYNVVMQLTDFEDAVYRRVGDQ